MVSRWVRGVVVLGLVLGVLGPGARPGLAGEDPCPEPNDAPETACPIGGRSSAAGYIHSPGDVDRYRIEVGEGQSVEASLTTLPHNYTLRLESSDGSVLAEAAGGGTEDRALGAERLAGGSYFLVVSSADGDSNADEPYTLQVNVSGLVAAPGRTVDPTAAPPPPPSDRPLDQLVLIEQEAGDRARASGKPVEGSDSRSKWYEVSFKRDNSNARFGPVLTINRVYRAVDVGTAQQIFREQARAGLPEAKQTNPNFKSLGPQAMDPIGEEGSAVGAGDDFNRDVVTRHFRIVFRMGTLVETLYTYGPDSGNNFSVAFSLAKTIEKRINTPPEGPPPEIFSNRQPAEIAFGLGEAGRQVSINYSRDGSDGRGRWYEVFYQRERQTYGQRMGPVQIYNKVIVANSNAEAREIYQEHAIGELPEATEPRGPIFDEPKTQAFGNESYAIGACNDDCSGANTEALHERLVFRWGNVVVVLYTWGREDQSNPDVISDYAKRIMGRIY